MNTIAYLVYGSNRSYHTELTGSVATLIKNLNGASDYRVLLVCDEVNARPDLPVQHMFYSADELARWTQDGAYNHEAKVHALLKVMRTCPTDKVMLVDTDTFFVDSPEPIFSGLSPTCSFMHLDEGPVGSREHPLWRNFVASGLVSGAAHMFNSGVVAVHPTNREAVERAIDTVHTLYAAENVFNVEQFAFTQELLKVGEVLPSGDIVKHWFHYERRFMHHQITAAFGEKYCSDAASRFNPRVCFPNKKTDAVLASVETMIHRETPEYRHAVLAARSALRDTHLADVWTEVLLDILRNNPTRISPAFFQRYGAKLKRCTHISQRIRDKIPFNESR